MSRWWPDNWALRPCPTGQVFQFTINSLGRLSDADQFENIIVKSDARAERSDCASARYCPGGSGAAVLLQLCQYRRAQLGPGRRLRPAGSKCHRRCQQRLQGSGGDEQGFPGRSEVCHPLRYHPVRPGGRLQGL